MGPRRDRAALTLLALSAFINAATAGSPTPAGVAPTWVAPPGLTASASQAAGRPAVFAPDTVSTGNVYRGSFTPDGNTLYFFKRIGDEGESYRIFRTRMGAAGWSEPQVVDLGGDHSDLYPAVSPDGSLLVFSSYRPAPGDPQPGQNANLWMAPAREDGWGEPVLLPVSTFTHYDVKPLLTDDGLLHFESTTPDWQSTRSMVARWNGETFVEAHPWDPVERWRDGREGLYVWGGIPSPDRELVLLEVSPIDAASGRRGVSEHWVSFRVPGSWSEPVPVPAMNAGGGGNFAFFNTAAAELFFVRDFERFLHLPAAAAFETLRPAAASRFAAAEEPLRFSAADGVRLHGELYRARAADDAPLVLLFHQGGGSAAEYLRIAPRLVAAGYHAVAVDLRRGGDLFGRSNRTVDELGDAVPASYCEVYPDLEATLREARARGLIGPAIAWGSSYSAALVMRLAVEHPRDIAAVAAFSPASGEPMAGCEPEPWAERLQQPLLVARPRRELDNAELGWIGEQFEYLRGLGATTLVAVDARHAASLLVAERSIGPTEPAWRTLEDFLYASVPPPGQRVVIDSDGWRLIGDLTLPLTEGPWPAALLLHNAAGSRAEQEGLAAELARRGIASLRLDLRGHGESTNLGRFDPDDLAGTRHTVDDAPADVQAALQALPELAAIDADRIAVVGASYTGETAAEAGRAMDRYQAAYVMLSPGDFSDLSIAAIDGSGAAWLTMRCEIERPFFDDLFAGIEAGSSAEIVIVPGDCHGTEILDAPGATAQVADWIAARLGAR